MNSHSNTPKKLSNFEVGNDYIETDQCYVAVAGPTVKVYMHVCHCQIPRAHYYELCTMHIQSATCTYIIIVVEFLSP